MTRDTYDSVTGEAYLYFADRAVCRTRVVDRCRLVDYAQDDALIGIEFFDARDGVRVEGLPVDGEVVTGRLHALGIRVLDTLEKEGEKG